MGAVSETHQMGAKKAAIMATRATNVSAVIRRFCWVCVLTNQPFFLAVGLALHMEPGMLMLDW